MLAVRDSGAALRALAGVSMRDAGATLRMITSASIRDSGGVLRTIFSAMSASVAPAEVFGVVDSAGLPTVTTSSATASPSGGTAPYNYAWSGPGGWTINSPAAGTTSFSKAGVAPGTEETESFTCTVTDASGATAQAVLQATVRNINVS